MVRKLEAVFHAPANQTNDLSDLNIEARYIELIDKTVKRIFLQNSMDHADVEDAAHNVLTAVLKILRKNNANKYIDNLDGYLVQVSKNETFKLVKAYRDKQITEYSLDDEANPIYIRSKNISIEKSTEIKLMYERSLNAFSFTQRKIEALLRTQMNGPEIAKLLNMRLCDVYKEIYKMRKIMAPLECYVKNSLNLKCEQQIPKATEQRSNCCSPKRRPK